MRLDLVCVNGTIDDITALFGTPGGACPSFIVNPACDLASFPALARSACLGKPNCTLSYDSRVSGDPCYGTEKAIAAVAHCTGSAGGYTRATEPRVGGSYYLIQPVINGSVVLDAALRHCGGVASFDPQTDPRLIADFQWRLVEGIGGLSTAVSLQSNNYPFDALGWLGSPPVISNAKTPVAVGHVSATGAGSPSVPPGDAAWYLEVGLDGSGLGYSLLLASGNATMYLQALSLTSCTLCVPCHSDGRGTAGDAAMAPQGALVALDGGVVLTQTFVFTPVDASGGGAPWATDHANAQNSGQTGGDGPGETAAVCTQQMLQASDAQLAASAPRFLSSGVTSAADSWWIGGATDDSLFLLEDLAVARQDDAAWQTLRLNLTQMLGVAQPAAPYGVVGAPAATADIVNADYRVFVASSNGYVAALNLLRCFSGASDMPQLPSAAVAAAAAAAPQAQVPPGAVRLSATSNGNAGQWLVYSNVNAVYAHDPPRFPYFVNSTTTSWPDCQARCWQNNSASGGEPNGCVAWTWHDPFVNPKYANQCWFKFTSGFKIKYEKDHVTGFLSTGVPGPECVSWSRPISTLSSSPGGTLRPSYSSVRIAGAGAGTGAGGGSVVLVSETDALLDTGGVLHGLNAANGSELFYYAATRDGASFGLKGIVPALLPGDPGIAVLAFSSRVVLLNVTACALAGPPAGACPELASWDSRSVDGGGDSFVSSPVVSGTSIFLHSSTGTLWALGITAAPSYSFLEQPLWACRYSRDAVSACTQPAAVSARRVPGGHARGVGRQTSGASPAAGTSQRRARSATSCTR